MRINKTTPLFRLKYHPSQEVENRILEHVDDRLFFDVKIIEEMMGSRVGRVKNPVQLEVWDPESGELPPEQEELFL